jgi:hypothetical protein
MCRCIYIIYLRDNVLSYLEGGWYSMLQYEILRNLISSKSNMRAAGPNTLNCYTTIRSTPAYLTLKINTSSMITLRCSLIN